MPETENELKTYYYKGPVLVREKLVDAEYYAHTQAAGRWQALASIRNDYIRKYGLNPERRSDVTMFVQNIKRRD